MTDTDANDGARATAAPAPSIEQAVGELGQAGREGFQAGLDVLHALRRLFIADLALARVALVRALVWLTIAVAFGASAWLLVMAAGIALLYHAGLSWLQSIALMAVLSLLVTALGAWQAMRYFEMSRLDATRRQLARLGIGGDGDDDDTDRNKEQ